ncbi:MAG: hypothetical protein J7K66_03990 [Anaerolineaceae bacterium]|nr:hypothetical protein [Anaerolineaceae bacterium]
MGKRLQFLLTIVAVLFFFTSACETLPPSVSDNNKIATVKDTLPIEVLINKAVAQTVAAIQQTHDASSVVTIQPENVENSAPPPTITLAPTPTVNSTQTPTFLPTSPPTVTPTPLPCNRPKFQGETIPDYSVFNPGDTFTKTWKIRNDGACTWTTDYRLVFTNGSRMGGPLTKKFTDTIKPGEIATFSVNLTAPFSSGTNTGVWKIVSKEGEQFGNYWTKIVVRGPLVEKTDTWFSADTTEPEVGICACNCSIDYDCPDFNTHQQAQDCFNCCGGSVGYNWSRLDRDRDGFACEANP